MKVELKRDGTLIVFATNELEDYALSNWCAKNSHNIDFAIDTNEYKNTVCGAPKTIGEAIR